MNFKEFKQVGHAGKDDKLAKGGIVYRIHRNISIRISWFLFRLIPAIQANHISVFNSLLLLSIFFLSFFISKHNAYYFIFIQLILLNFSSILDKVDGELARAKRKISQKGMYYDLLFHFFYPFVFYFSLGFFFFIFSFNTLLLFATLVLSMLAIGNKLFGKLRHHIKFKINLERNENNVVDFVEDIKKQKRHVLPIRILYYCIFLLYDWAWGWHVILVLIAYIHFRVAYIIFIVYVTVAIIWVGYNVFIANPRSGLFKREEV